MPSPRPSQSQAGSRGRNAAPLFWRACAALLFALLATNPARAFGPTGHRVSGALADQLLTPAAAAQVKRLIGMPLRTAATWADCVKDVNPVAGKGFVYQPDPRFHAACATFETAQGIARMQDYVSRNWNQCDLPRHPQACHKKYHFADVAIQHDHYDRAFAGTSDHDIVSALGAIIEVLQGRPAPAPFNLKDPREALMLLAHLVGDVHQPLHVGSVYLDAANQPFDPGSAGTPVDPHADTHGGNDIEDRSSKLHAEWDEVNRSLNPLALPPALLAAARAVTPTAGDPKTWPAAWASQTVLSARQAYEGLAYTHTGAQAPGDWVLVVADRAAYAKRRDALQQKQLALAGARLAQLLNVIFR